MRRTCEPCAPSHTSWTARGLPLRDYTRECLGIDCEWLHESLFEAAHTELDAALPRTPGSLADRLHAWQAAHVLPQARMDRLPAIVAAAVEETRARTQRIIPLPAGAGVDCQVVPQAHFLAAGHYHGNLRGTIYVNGSLPFNLADLFYVVAHEGYPGHIAESMLKDVELVERRGRGEQQIRFMLAPSFVISEGLGLHAPEIVFPGDEAQSWLDDNILGKEGIASDGSDFARIQRARNVLWGAWGNAASLRAEGRPPAEISDYLSRWALLDDAELAAARAVFDAPGMSLYMLAYYHGWHIVESWLDAPDRSARVRLLLTEQVLPADLEPTPRVEKSQLNSDSGAVTAPPRS